MKKENRPGQIDHDIGVYYEITGSVWGNWISQLFWSQFQNAVPAKKRIDAIESIFEKEVC